MNYSINDTNTCTLATILAALLTKRVLHFVYTDQDGVVSIRKATVTSITRCANDQVVVNAFDLNRDAPRKFRVDSMSEVGYTRPGSLYFY